MPATARTTRVPVVSALLRNTDIAPSTTQKPCCTGKTWVIATASASPSPVRRLLRTTTARVATKPDGSDAMACDSDSTRSAAPDSGSLSAEHPGPHRAGVGRGGEPMTRPVAPTHAEIVRRSTACAPMPMAVGVARFGEDLDDVVAVATLARPRVARPTPTRARRGGAARSAPRGVLSTSALSRSTRTMGMRISTSRAPVSSATRSDSHCRSSTTRTSARLPAVSPTGR